MPRSRAVCATLCGPDERRQLGEDGVVGDRYRLRQVDRAERLALVVVDHPHTVTRVDRHLLRRGEGARRRDVLPQRGRKDEGLERGAGLALALGGEIELVLVVVLAADHGEHGAGLCIESDERGGRAGARRQYRGDRIARRLLETDIECRRHAQAAPERSPRAERMHELVLDVVGEVRRCDTLRRREVRPSRDPASGRPAS